MLRKTRVKRDKFLCSSMDHLMWTEFFSLRRKKMHGALTIVNFMLCKLFISWLFSFYRQITGEHS